jgi:hypothetical protein
MDNTLFNPFYSRSPGFRSVIARIRMLLAARLSSGTAAGGCRDRTRVLIRGYFAGVGAAFQICIRSLQASPSRTTIDVQ